MQDPDYIKFFFKSISSDGRTVTVSDMRKMLADFKLDVASAEEFIERTAGLQKAKSFNLDQLSEVLSGRVIPQTIAQMKKKELELQEQRQQVQKMQEEIHVKEERAIDEAENLRE